MNSWFVFKAVQFVFKLGRCQHWENPISPPFLNYTWGLLSKSYWVQPTNVLNKGFGTRRASSIENNRPNNGRACRNEAHCVHKIYEIKKENTNVSTREGTRHLKKKSSLNNRNLADWSATTEIFKAWQKLKQTFPDNYLQWSSVVYFA